MRRMRWDELQAQRRANLLDMLQRGTLQRLPRTRPRDRDEERALSLIVQARWKRWLETGKLTMLAPRRWRLRLGNMPEDSP